MTPENPFGAPKPIARPEQLPSAEQSVEDEIITAELSIDQRLAQYFQKPEIGQYPGSTRVFVRVELDSEADFSRALELLSIVGIDPWDDANIFSITIDNRFDIEMLIERGIVPRDVFREDKNVEDEFLAGFSTDEYAEKILPTSFPLENMQAIPDIFGKNGKPVSDFDNMNEGEEMQKSYSGDTSYLYKQYTRKYSRVAGELYRKNGQERQLISAEDQQELLERAKEGDKQARNELLTMNMGLVYFVMFNVSRRLPWASQADLLQEGLIQMDKCIDDYNKDHSTKARFSTFAVANLQWRMYNSILENRPYIDVPVNVQANSNKVNKLEDKPRNTEGRAISPFDLARELAISTHAAQQLIEHRDFLANLEFLDIADDTLTHEALVDDFDVIDEVAKNELTALLARDLDRLAPQQSKVLRMHFGIDRVGGEMSLREIGIEIGVSLERVRQIEYAAMKALKDPAFYSQYVPYLGYSVPAAMDLELSKLQLKVQSIPSFQGRVDFIDTLIKEEEKAEMANPRFTSGSLSYLKRMREKAMEQLSSLEEPGR
jgi:RNA polymerase primary sigma factor